MSSSPSRRSGDGRRGVGEEGSLQSQVDMLRDKNELMNKELAKPRRKVERAEEEAEAARAEALQASMSTRNSPGVSMKTSRSAARPYRQTRLPRPCLQLPSSRV